MSTKASDRGTWAQSASKGTSVPHLLLDAALGAVRAIMNSARRSVCLVMATAPAGRIGALRSGGRPLQLGYRGEDDFGGDRVRDGILLAGTSATSIPLQVPNVGSLGGAFNPTAVENPAQGSPERD
ncbi:hypothetical protein ON010_g17729 [Phytophthora cinnamomi]|nr:hypothetical protein ON010_g17729 [Phytophthora cinnamomi]